MKTTEEYFDDYLDKYNELSKKGELWRLRVTPEKFLSEIERLRVYEREQTKINLLNAYHIQRNIEGTISIMLMDKPTEKEFIEQIKMIQNSKRKK